MSRYILTGAPGCGKTSVIKALESDGYSVIHEAATDVIAEEQALGNAKPWMSENFINKTLALQKKRQLGARSLKSLQFFDRSPFCTYALSLYLGYKPPDDLEKEIKRIQDHGLYDQKVFFLENLGFIETTEARQINFEEALKFEALHLELYARFGYTCVKIPAMAIHERAAFVLMSAVTLS